MSSPDLEKGDCGVSEEGMMTNTPSSPANTSQSTVVEMGDSSSKSSTSPDPSSWWIPPPAWRVIIELLYVAVFVLNLICTLYVHIKLWQNSEEFIGFHPEIQKLERDATIHRMRAEVWIFLLIECLVLMFGCIMKSVWHVSRLLPLMLIGMILKIVPFVTLQKATASLYYVQIILPYQNETCVTETSCRVTLWDVMQEHNDSWVFVWRFVQLGLCVITLWSLFTWQRYKKWLTRWYNFYVQEGKIMAEDDTGTDENEVGESDEVLQVSNDSIPDTCVLQVGDD